MAFTQIISDIQQFLLTLQSDLCDAIGVHEAKKFNHHRRESNTHISRIASIEGNVIERGAINVSTIMGDVLPSAASERHPECAGSPFQVSGLSMILHPQNPHAPTMHANLRCFISGKDQQVRWIGGGLDLTPCYAYHEDAIHWHRTIKEHCLPFGNNLYDQFKKNCDDYFYLPHRKEHRGIGGIFFDDLTWPESKSIEFIKSIGHCIKEAYLPILAKRHKTPFSPEQKQFQQMRRGRYVEFNLMYDRGTKFGLEFGSQPDQILVSLPTASWHYNYPIAAGSHEAQLTEYLQPRNWLAETTAR